MTTDTRAADRRRRYRINNMRAGKCRWCPNKISDTGRSVCLRHHVIYLLRKQGLTKGVLGTTNRRRREAIVAYIQGREVAIRSGHLDPGTDEQRLKDVIDLRLRAGITWGGVRGADKIAQIVRNVDLSALRKRKNEQREQSATQRGTIP